MVLQHVLCKTAARRSNKYMLLDEFHAALFYIQKLIQKCHALVPVKGVATMSLPADTVAAARLHGREGWRGIAWN